MELSRTFLGNNPTHHPILAPVLLLHDLVSVVMTLLLVHQFVRSPFQNKEAHKSVGMVFLADIFPLEVLSGFIVMFCRIWTQPSSKGHRDVNMEEYVILFPPEQAAVECPICHKRLPELSRQHYLRSVRAHCASAHPGQTPRSLFHKRATGRKKKTDGVSKCQLAAHEATRKKHYRTRDIFGILPTENSKAERGRVLYCRNCLAHVQKEAPDVRKLTCKQRLQRLRTNPWTRMMKRTWWTRLKAAQPKHAEEFLRLSGWSQAELEDLLGLNCPTPRMLQCAKEREENRSAKPKAKPRAQWVPKRKPAARASTAAVRTPGGRKGS